MLAESSPLPGWGDLEMSPPLLEAVESHREAMVELSQALIAIPSENPPGNEYQRAADLLSRRLRDLGFGDTRVEGDCVMSFLGSGERTLYFSGHYDVVPAQSASQFEPAVKGANLFGRGSSDMKGGLAAMIYAAVALSECGVRLHGRIGLVFVPDEETAGPRGSRYLAESGLLGANGMGMLTPEPTGGVVWNANRGAITLRVTIRGKAAHVGRQHEGVNAFERMLPVAQALAELKTEVEARSTGFRIQPDAARRSILMLGGRAEAGTNFNTVPDACSFSIDRRINPEEDFEEEKRRLLGVLEQARAAGTELEVEVLQEGRSCGADPESELGRALARSIQGVTGRAAQFEMCPGLLEIRFYAERGIPAFAYGPGLLTVSHGPNEFVPVDRMVQCAQIYALTAAEMLA
ncbi:MAG TPA: ArgE/DapE family deacylase [Bryobacteraceae bacterium]|nr:ArgE/DapE family deacylase [Bryobacteraceae bacterium]